MKPRSRTRYQVVIYGSSAVLIGGWMAHVLSQLIFSVLGAAAEDPAWPSSLTLHGFLAVTGATSGLRAYTTAKSRRRIGLELISGSCSGAILGFFCAGSLTQNNLNIAILGAVLGGLSVAAIYYSSRHQTHLRQMVAIAITAAGAVAGYGFAFLIGSWAMALLSSQHLVWGILLGFLVFIYLGFVMQSLVMAWQQIVAASN